MSTTYKPVYTAAATYTISPQNVASSTTAGVQSDAVSNITDLYIDHLVSGFWTAGTTPTANTLAQAYFVAPLTDDLSSSVTWPDTITGAGAAAKTITSVGILATLGAVVGVCVVDGTTSNRTYPSLPTSAASKFGGVIPSRHVLFVIHNTAVNSNTTAGNHAWYRLPIQLQGV